MARSIRQQRRCLPKGGADFSFGQSLQSSGHVGNRRSNSGCQDKESISRQRTRTAELCEYDEVVVDDKKHWMSWGGWPGHLSDLLRRLGKRKHVPHAVAAVERGDGSFRWSDAIGRADTSGTRMRNDTPCFLASIDKLYNAMIILKLHERGQVRLDEPITTYLPMALVRGLHRLKAPTTGARSPFDTC